MLLKRQLSVKYKPKVVLSPKQLRSNESGLKRLYNLEK